MKWIILLCTYLLAFQALGQSVCMRQQIMREKLENQFGEEPAALGLLNDGRLLEIWASTDGNFTQVATDQYGKSCVLLVGSDLFIRYAKLHDKYGGL